MWDHNNRSLNFDPSTDRDDRHDHTTLCGSRRHHSNSGQEAL